MFASNPSSLFFSYKPKFSSIPLLPRRTLRCLAVSGNIPKGLAFPRWFQYTSSAADFASGGGGNAQIGIDSDGAGVVDGAARRGGNSGGIKVNAKEKKWSRDRESYLDDDSDALPLPMTYPDTSPVSPDEIDRRLRCDPKIEVIFLCSINKYHYSLTNGSLYIQLKPTPFYFFLFTIAFIRIMDWCLFKQLLLDNNWGLFGGKIIFMCTECSNSLYGFRIADILIIWRGDLNK